MECIPVRLNRSSYDILVGTGVSDDLEKHLSQAALCEPFLVISQPRILKAVGKSMKKRFPVVSIPRQSTVIAFGGGVVGDVAGFVASIYMRGIAVVQIPTTLLAQVDSSIGGKTGVNHRVAKNLIGTFHQPRLVLSDPLILQTLPEREYASGLYEALKYGVIGDPALFEEFERNTSMLKKRDPEAVERLVARCAAIKAEVVMSDEKESDLRRVLNFGHTVGHALEAAARYQRIKHGEAVGYGMVAAARIGRALEKINDREVRRIENAIASIGRLPALDGVSSKDVLGALHHDKKVRNGAIHFVLPRAIGNVEITPEVPFEIVREVVKGILNDGKRLFGPG